MAADQALRFDDIVKTFGGTRALKGVSFTVGRGEVVALLGENGAGKSTIIKVLGGIVRSDSGQITIAGEPYRHKANARGERQAVAFIHQDLGLIEWMTVAENMSLGQGFPRAGWSGKLGLIDWGAARTARGGGPRPCRLRHRPHHPRPQPLPHREIAGGHRPRAGRRLRFSRARRTDGQPSRQRGGAAVRRRATPAGAWCRHDLRVAPARRDLSHRRPRGGHARRAEGRRETGGGDDPPTIS